MRECAQKEQSSPLFSRRIRSYSLSIALSYHQRLPWAVPNSKQTFPGSKELGLHPDGRQEAGVTVQWPSRHGRALSKPEILICLYVCTIAVLADSRPCPQGAVGFFLGGGGFQPQPVELCEISFLEANSPSCLPSAGDALGKSCFFGVHCFNRVMARLRDTASL